MDSYFGAKASQVKALYPAANKRQVLAAKSQFLTDTWFVAGARNMLQGMDKVSSPAYQYHFTRKSARTPMLGAAHGAEIMFAFGNLVAPQNTEVDRKLSAAMIQYWVQFAKTGNPDVEGLPAWPQFKTTNDQHLELGDKIRVGTNLRKEAIAVYDSL